MLAGDSIQKLCEQHAPAINRMLAEADGTEDRNFQIQAIAARILKYMIDNGCTRRTATARCSCH